MLFLAADAVASLSIQWGNNFWRHGRHLGARSAIIWRVRRFHITATYVVSFLVFALLRSWMTGDPWQSEISPITGPEYQLFIFFMITDPKTTVKSKVGQCVVAFSVAVIEMFFRLDQSIYAPFYALFCTGPVALLIEMAGTLPLRAPISKHTQHRNSLDLFRRRKSIGSCRVPGSLFTHLQLRLTRFGMPPTS